MIPEPAYNGASSAKPYILVIEDSASDIRLLDFCLSANGFSGNLFAFQSGTKARDFLWSSPPMLPSLILMDIHLPEMEGIDLLEAIRLHPFLKDIPVIVWTGQYSHHEAEICRNLNTLEYFEKPIDVNVLNLFAERMITRWEQFVVAEHEEKAGKK
ncbi:MAG: response regulator [Bacteroidia bacterium]